MEETQEEGEMETLLIWDGGVDGESWRGNSRHFPNSFSCPLAPHDLGGLVAGRRQCIALLPPAELASYECPQTPLFLSRHGTSCFLWPYILL